MYKNVPLSVKAQWKLDIMILSKVGTYKLILNIKKSNLEDVDIDIFILVVLIYQLTQEYVYDVVNFKFRRKKNFLDSNNLWDNSDWSNKGLRLLKREGDPRQYIYSSFTGEGRGFEPRSRLVFLQYVLGSLFLLRHNLDEFGRFNPGTVD